MTREYRKAEFLMPAHGADERMRGGRSTIGCRQSPAGLIALAGRCAIFIAMALAGFPGAAQTVSVGKPVIIAGEVQVNAEGAKPRIERQVRDVAPETVRVEWQVSFDAPADVMEAVARFRFLPDEPSAWPEAGKAFHWIPQIKEKPHQIAADHSFRSPVVIVTAARTAVAVIPDVEVLASSRPASHFLDLRFPEGEAPIIDYGVADSRPEGHIYFGRTGKPLRADSFQFACYVLYSRKTTPEAFLNRVSAFLWDQYGKQYIARHAPQVVPFETYARYGYEMALRDLWVEGPKPGTGGITLATYVDRKTGERGGRESLRDLWFHSWFNNLRTAWGLLHWGQRLSNRQWTERASNVHQLLMTSPNPKGFFPMIYRSVDRTWQNSSYDHGGGPGLYHLPDQAWTAIWLLRWPERSASADAFLTRFAQALLSVRHSTGGFPTLVRVENHTADPVLDSSASGALPVWFLGEMILANRLDARTRAEAEAAVKAGVDWLRSHVLPDQRFEDYELYFSCSKKPLNFYDPVTKMYGQNTLAMQWCAEAFRVAYLLFQRPEDLSAGRFCLDLLSLYQQVWSPPYLDLMAFGGFGVMNTDGEWNDARQAQFAETFANYYDITKEPALLERAVAAARASFALVVMEENRDIAPNNYRGNRYETKGASAENYGHSGRNRRSGRSGFHWGTGSALTTAIALERRYGDLIVDAERCHAVGLDGVVVASVKCGGKQIELDVKALPRSGRHSGRLLGKAVRIRLNGRTVVPGEKSNFEW